MDILTCPANNTFSTSLSGACAFVFVRVNFDIHAHTLFFMQAHVHTYVCVKGCLCQNNLHIRSSYCRFHPYHLYIGTPWSDSGNSPPFHREPSIIPHRIRDKKKKEREREKVQGRDCSFTFCSWQSLHYNLAEIIEVLKLLPVSPSVFLPLCLC